MFHVMLRIVASPLTNQSYDPIGQDFCALNDRAYFY